MANPMDVASPEPHSVHIFHILHRISKTKVAKNKYAYSIIDKHQHMHFFTFKTVLV